MYNAWNWSIKPADAKKHIDGLADEYLSFLDMADDDGYYLDYGYSDLAEAICNAKKQEKIKGDVPDSDDEWNALEFSTDDYSNGKGKSFTNELVIGETMKAWSRKPDKRDVGTIKRRFEIMHGLPMAGERDKSMHNVEGA